MLALILLAGCDTLPKVVNVEVPVPCIKPGQAPQKPAMATDQQLAALAGAQHVKTLYRDRLLAAGYIGELEAAIEGCSKLPAR